MNKPTNNHRISWDDNATSLGSPQNHHITVDSDVNDTTEDDEIDEFRIRSLGNRSPVTFYIESESSKVGNLAWQRKQNIDNYLSQIDDMQEIYVYISILLY